MTEKYMVSFVYLSHMTQASDDRILQSTSTTLQLIEFMRSQAGVGVQEVADELGVSPSTAHSHLATLKQKQYAVKRDGKYHLGLKFLGLGIHVQTQREEFVRAEHYTSILAEESECRSVFMVEEHGYGYYIHTAPGKHGIWTKTTVGKQAYLHTTGTGKAILAHLPPDTVDAIVESLGLPRKTERTICTRKELDAELATVRDQGYAINAGEQINGVTAIGAPVNGPGGEIVGAIGVAGPSNKLQGESVESALIENVLGIANEFELNLALS